jgi:hypothetical protein
MDIADEGKDKNGFSARYGFLLQEVEEWSGEGSDIYASVAKAFGFCDDFGIDEFRLMRTVLVRALVVMPG